MKTIRELEEEHQATVEALALASTIGAIAVSFVIVIAMFS